MKKILTLSFALCSLFAAKAQEAAMHCGTDIVMRRMMEKDPALKARLQAIEEETQAVDRAAAKHKYNWNVPSADARVNSINQVASTVYTVPVVFHILHQGGTENISNAQCIDAVRIMNRDYAKLNPDTTVTIAQYKGIAGTVNIQFVLATKDPAGNCTNGIERFYDANTAWDQSSSSCDYTWDPRHYLNVYVVKSIASMNGFSAAAYTYLPGTWGSGSAYDCIISLHSYVGSIGTSSDYHSRTLTHEAGHWFNLQHTWGGNNSAGVACGDDGVTDTPVTKGDNLVCNLNNATCNPPTVENVQNYMDYSYCTTMFTNGQVTRMRNTIINNTGNVGRNQLPTTTNLTNTGVINPIVCSPKGAFYADKRNVCINTAVTFKDSTLNTQVTSYNWSFPGGTPSASTDSIPVVTYSAAGVYAVTYTAANSAGDSIVAKSNYITVSNNVAAYQAAYTESFESITVPGADWSVANTTTGAQAWQQNNTSGNTGTHSVWVNNLSNAVNASTTLFSPSFNFSSMFASASSPTFTFKLAYAQTASSNNDKLQILLSSDCGASWTSRYSKNGAALGTTAATAANFVPSSADWRTETVNVGAFSTQSNVWIKFVFFSGSSTGNNLYIDDINLPAQQNGIRNFANSVSNFNLYPNPTSKTSTVSFSLTEKHNVHISLVDVLGKNLEEPVNKALSAGEYNFEIGSNSNLAPGIYFVNMNVDGNASIKKIIVK